MNATCKGGPFNPRHRDTLLARFHLGTEGVSLDPHVKASERFLPSNGTVNLVCEKNEARTRAEHRQTL
jgi:hypothetical protein